jgi:leucyl/phenylalanyl-tRNA---protein transferase
MISGDYYQLLTGRVIALSHSTPFPPPSYALSEPNGLIAIGGDLSPERLINAYQSGIFPWYSEGEPILWWCPHPRMVLFPDRLKVSKSLKKRLNRNDYEVAFNQHFDEIISACASTPRPNQAGTWISPEMKDAYLRLAKLGYLMCAGTFMNNILVGGLYGVIINKMFFGESMFHHVTDASKIAFVHLVSRLKQMGVGMIDCQMKTAHLASLGAQEISQTEFLTHLSKLTHHG